MRDHIHKMLSLTYICFAARVVTDRVSGYSKGFGFVRYATVEEAAEGIKGMDGKVSWSLFVILNHVYTRMVHLLDLLRVSVLIKEGSAS